MKVQLIANVVVLGDRKNRKSIKTACTVKMGTLNLAKGLFGGEYNPEQVIRELKTNPQRFALIHPEAKVILESQGVKFPALKVAA